MKIMAFDLSSVCIGCVVAKLDNHKIEKIASAPIIPKKDSDIPLKLGFIRTKHKCENGLTSYVKYSGENVSKAEKKRRDVLVRDTQNAYILENISKELSDVITAISPDKIVVEKHAIFNGILTSVLLAKISGILIGVAGDNGISVSEYPVKEVRSIYNLPELTKEFIKTKKPEDLIKIPDVTKASIGFYLSKKYGITFKTYDESDACAVFDYYMERKYEHD